MVEIYRTVFKKEIVCEFTVPKKDSNKVLIIAGGMPSSPSKREVIEKFTKAGYWVFAPRYRGTWESYGKFLAKSPHEDIKDVIDGVYSEVTEMFDMKKFKIRNPQIFLLGVSFGGPAVILNSSDKRVKKVLAVSSVVDWREDSRVEPLDKLGVFVKRAFGRAYDYSDRDWNKLSRGGFYSPIDEIKNIDGKKIWMVHAMDDEVVSFAPSERFAKLVNCKFTPISKGGHGIGKKVLGNWFWFRKVKNWLK